jgi:hypothetical protein
MSAIFDVLWFIVASVLGVVWWIVWAVLWSLAWLLLPLLVIGYLALRASDQIFGKAAVRAWLTARAAALGGGVWFKVSRGLMATSALPFRVLFWLVTYTLWHSIISIFWRPRWQPWQRAWAKRWKPERVASTRAAAKRNAPKVTEGKPPSGAAAAGTERGAGQRRTG